MDAIEKYWIPLGAQCNPCRGGYFFWVRLPPGLTSDVVAEEALKEGVSIMGGTSCKVPNDNSIEYNRFIRICVALEKEEKAAEGIKRVGVVFKRLLRK